MFLFTYFSPSSQSPMMTLSFVIIVIIAASLHHMLCLASPYALPRLATCFACLAIRSDREISLHCLAYTPALPL